MTIHDKSLALAESVDLDGLATGTHAGTRTFLFGPTDGSQQVDMGVGKPFMFNLRCEQSLTSGGSATLNIQFVSSATSNLATPTVHWETGVLAYNDAKHLTIGLEKHIPFPVGQLYKAYLGILFVIGTAQLTAGIFSCDLVGAPQAYYTYRNGRSFA